MGLRAVAPAPALAAALVVALPSSGSKAPVSAWHLPNADLASSRAGVGSGIDRANVSTLRPVWRFRFRIPPAEPGVFTATPIVDGGTVYLEDMKSNVWALALSTGRVRWRRYFNATNPGPNGLAVRGGRVYGTTDSSAFALDAATGRTLWRRFLVTASARFVDIAPQVAGGLVFVSTIGLPPNGRGVLFGLDAGTGKIRWERSTIKGAWAVPAEAGGGGAWYAPSVSGNEVYWGLANPYPYGGSRAHPNGGAYRGKALYTDSLLVVDARSGAIRWFDQVTPHDVRDHDFEAPPVLTTAGGRKLVIGAGKAGWVIAWDRATHRRLWETPVGLHRHDIGPLPRRPVSVCPGLLGGVETPMASAGGQIYVPVVDLCMRASSTGYEPLAGVNVARRGRGKFVALSAATGRILWTDHLAEADLGCATVADGVVFTSTFDGTVLALDTADGRVLWRWTLRAGVNACPAVAAGWLLVGAGVPIRHDDHLELTAFRVVRPR